MWQSLLQGWWTKWTTFATFPILKSPKFWGHQEYTCVSFLCTWFVNNSRFEIDIIVQGCPDRAGKGEESNSICEQCRCSAFPATDNPNPPIGNHPHTNYPPYNLPPHWQRWGERWLPVTDWSSGHWGNHNNHSKRGGSAHLSRLSSQLFLATLQLEKRTKSHHIPVSLNHRRAAPQLWPLIASLYPRFFRHLFRLF